MLNGEMHHPKFPRALQYSESSLYGSLFEINIEHFNNKFSGNYPRYNKPGSMLLKKQIVDDIIKRFESIGEVIQHGGSCRCNYFISSDLFCINLNYIEDNQFIRLDYIIFSDTVDGMNIGYDTINSAFSDILIEGVLCFVT